MLHIDFYLSVFRLSVDQPSCRYPLVNIADSQRYLYFIGCLQCQRQTSISGEYHASIRLIDPCKIYLCSFCERQFCIYSLPFLIQRREHSPHIFRGLRKIHLLSVRVYISTCQCIAQIPGNEDFFDRSCFGAHKIRILLTDFQCATVTGFILKMEHFFSGSGKADDSIGAVRNPDIFFVKSKNLVRHTSIYGTLHGTVFLKHHYFISIDDPFPDRRRRCPVNISNPVLECHRALFRRTVFTQDCKCVCFYATLCIGKFPGLTICTFTDRDRITVSFHIAIAFHIQMICKC